MKQTTINNGQLALGDVEISPYVEIRLNMPVYGVIFCDHFDRLIAYWTFEIKILSV